MLPWSLEHHVFACDTYMKNGESVTEIQRLFKQNSTSVVTVMYQAAISFLGGLMH